MRSLDCEIEEILIAIMGRVPLALLRISPLLFFKALRDELERAAVLGDRAHNLGGDTIWHLGVDLQPDPHVGRR
jgi:hypothetical protein